MLAFYELLRCLQLGSGMWASALAVLLLAEATSLTVRLILLLSKAYDKENVEVQAEQEQGGELRLFTSPLVQVQASETCVKDSTLACSRHQDHN